MLACCLAKFNFRNFHIIGSCVQIWSSSMNFVELVLIAHRFLAIFVPGKGGALSQGRLALLQASRSGSTLLKPQIKGKRKTTSGYDFAISHFCWALEEKNKFGHANRPMRLAPLITLSAPLRPLQTPHHPLPIPLALRSPIRVKITRFRVFEKNRVLVGRTDGRTDPLIEMRGRIQKLIPSV